MYDPNDRIELPYEHVRQLFVETAEKLGCDNGEAGSIAQSAWHLANRGLDGVDYTLRYLSLLQRDEDVPRNAIVLLAFDMSTKLNTGDRRVSSFLGAPAPLLLLPAASFWLQDADVMDGILFTFNDQTVVYSTTHGMRIESADPRGLMTIDPLDAPTCTASRVDFLEGERQGIEFPREKNLTLHLPRSVYAGDGPLNLTPLLG